MAEGRLPVRGLRLYYRTMGRGEPILVLHGGPALSHDYLVPPLKPLAAGARLVFFDQRGCGRSSKPEDRDYSMDAMADDVEAVRRRLRLGRVNLFGFSYGGMLALHTALRHPAGIRRLIVAGAWPSGAALNERLAEVRAAAPAPVRATIERVEAEGLFARGDRYPPEYAAAADEAYRPYSFHRLAAPPPEVADVLGNLSFDTYRAIWGDRGEFRVTGVLGTWDVTGRLREIAAPTLILLGRYDLTPVSEGEAMAKAIPRARLVVFEESGHFFPVEEPDRFLAETRAFLASPA